MSEKIDQLKQEADELGISYNPRIGEDKLQAKIDAFYKAQETSGKEVDEAIEAVETENVDENTEDDVTETTKSAKTIKVEELKGKRKMAVLARELYEKAKVTKIVTIIDNDQRVNNQTTTCKANWTNEYYDLGTKTFPLNTPIEIAVGFIKVLKNVRIPHHVKDMKTGLSKTTMRPRYSISEE